MTRIDITIIRPLIHADFFIIMDIPKEDFADCFAKWKDMSH